MLKDLRSVFESTSPATRFSFFDGSEVLNSLLPGGIDEFHTLDEVAKLRVHESAITHIRISSLSSGCTGIIAGHFMFWPANSETPEIVCTQKDLEAYSAIIYLDVAPSLIYQWRMDDSRRREDVSVEHLVRWQEKEKLELQTVCREHGILFSSVSWPGATETIADLIISFEEHSEAANIHRVQGIVDRNLCGSNSSPPDTVFVFDADKTLAAEDAGEMFWDIAQRSKSAPCDTSPLKTLFSTLGYSHTAFRQSALLYEQFSRDDFESLCEKVASRVTIHPELSSLIHMLSLTEHKSANAAALVVTCGIPVIWEKILLRHGLADMCKVVGAHRISDKGTIVVTPSVKSTIVSYIRDAYSCYVIAFGDSPFDLGMLSEAHEAIVVVGEEQKRSRSMDGVLGEAITKRGLRARQVLLPASCSHRLDTVTLPLVCLRDEQFIQSVLSPRRPAFTRVAHATDLAASKVLMTPTRDASLAGPSLREAHRRIGFFLANQFLTFPSIIGLETYSIPHVQGGQTGGYRFRDEARTLIVPLMRGGEPMAFGVNEALPLAMFAHAKVPSDLDLRVHRARTIILVDSVINTGGSIVEFIQHIRGLDATVRIVIVAGVVQEKALASTEIEDGEITFLRVLEADVNVYLVALRLSENKFKGTGGTDTGNRLFNTTHLA